MLINKKCKIELAVSEDENRWMLKEPYFTGRELVATDGHMMAVVKVKGEKGDKPGYISGAFLKRLRSGLPRLRDTVSLGANGDLKGLHPKEGEIHERRPLEGEAFVDWKAVLPEERKEAVVSLDPVLLYRLAQAIGYGKSVTLHFPLDEDGNIEALGKIRVLNNGSENRENIGVLMPCRTWSEEGEAEETEEEPGAEPAGLDIELPEIEAIREEVRFAAGCQDRTLTRVCFKDGSALTFNGVLEGKDAARQAFYQKYREAGFSPERAERLAEAKAEQGRYETTREIPLEEGEEDVERGRERAFKVVLHEPDYQGTMQEFGSLERAKKYFFGYEGKDGFVFVPAPVTGGGYMRRPSAGFPGKFDCIQILEVLKPGMEGVPSGVKAPEVRAS